MKKRLLAVLAMAGLAVGGIAGAAFAGNGQAIGQDPVRLALTQCSNAGGGNGGEFEAALGTRSVLSDCLNKRLGSRYSQDEINGILAQAGCVQVIILTVCEIDPGNSASHNQAQQNL